MTVKTAIVSGGSRGLGLDICAHLLREGWKVATFARRSTPAVEQLVRENPRQLLFSTVSIQDIEQVRRFVTDVHETMGPIGALINNVAIGQDNLFAHLSNEKIDDIIGINLLGPIYLTKEIVKRMILDNVQGSIVNISSICGTVGYKGLSVYSATKGALDAFSRSLGCELGERGIRVNSVAPGFFASEMSALLSDAQIQIIKNRTPTKQLIEPIDVVRAIDFLLASPAVTCTTVFVDGGTVHV